MRDVVFARGNARTSDRLKRLRLEAQADKAVRVALRIQAIMLSLQKHTTVDIAHLLHVPRSRTYAWIKAWNDYGPDGLLEGHRSGRPTALSESQLEHLGDIIDSGPVAYGLHTGVWTSPLIGSIIADEFGVTYHQGHVRKLLKKLDFSVQRPTTSLSKARPHERNRWIRYEYPCLKKKPRRRTQR